jgi:hypothetical protein
MGSVEWEFGVDSHAESRYGTGCKIYTLRQIFIGRPVGMYGEDAGGPGCFNLELL